MSQGWFEHCWLNMIIGIWAFKFFIVEISNAWETSPLRSTKMRVDFHLHLMWYISGLAQEKGRCQVCRWYSGKNILTWATEPTGWIKWYLQDICPCNSMRKIIKAHNMKQEGKFKIYVAVTTRFRFFLILIKEFLFWLLQLVTSCDK